VPAFITGCGWADEAFHHLEHGEVRPLTGHRIGTSSTASLIDAGLRIDDDREWTSGASATIWPAVAVLDIGLDRALHEPHRTCGTGRTCPARKVFHRAAEDVVAQRLVVGGMLAGAGVFSTVTSSPRPKKPSSRATRRQSWTAFIIDA